MRNMQCISIHVVLHPASVVGCRQGGFSFELPGGGGIHIDSGSGQELVGTWHVVASIGIHCARAGTINPFHRVASGKLT